MLKKIIISVVILLGLVCTGVGVYFIIQNKNKPSVSDYTYAYLRTLPENEKAPYLIIDNDFITVFVDVNEEKEIKVTYKTNDSADVKEVVGKATKDDKNDISLPIKLERKTENYKVEEFKVYYNNEEIYSAPFSFIVSKKNIKEEEVDPVVKTLTISSIKDNVVERVYNVFDDSVPVNFEQYTATLTKDGVPLNIQDIVVPNEKKDTITIDKTKLEDGIYTIDIKVGGPTSEGVLTETFEVNIKKEFTNFSLETTKNSYMFGDKRVEFVVSFDSSFSITNDKMEILELRTNQNHKIEGQIEENMLSNGKFHYNILCSIEVLNATEQLVIELDLLKVKVNTSAVVLDINPTTSDGFKFKQEVHFVKPVFETITTISSESYFINETALVEFDLTFSGVSNKAYLTSIVFDNGFDIVPNVEIVNGRTKATYKFPLTMNNFKATKIVINSNGVNIEYMIPVEQQKVITYKVVNAPVLINYVGDFKMEDEKKILKLTFDDNAKYFDFVDFKYKVFKTTETFAGSNVAFDKVNNQVSIDVTHLFDLNTTDLSNVMIEFESFEFRAPSANTETHRRLSAESVTDKIYILSNSSHIKQLLGIRRANGNLEFTLSLNEAYPTPKEVSINFSYYNEYGGQMVEMEYSGPLKFVNGVYVAETSSMLGKYTGKIKVNHITIDGARYSNFIGAKEDIQLDIFS